MTSRAEFLDLLRSKGATPANLPHPFVPVAEMPAVKYVRDLSDTTRAFTEAATRVGAKVVDGNDLDRLLADLMQEHGVRSAVVSADPEVADVPAVLARLGVDVVERGGHTAKEADLGITGAAWGVAATGSLVLHAGRAGGRTSGLVPPLHLALLRVENILPEAGALWRHLPERLPDGLPSNLAFATGPSRSGDIEMVITVGVHGPKAVIIGLLS